MLDLVVLVLAARVVDDRDAVPCPAANVVARQLRLRLPANDDDAVARTLDQAVLQLERARADLDGRDLFVGGQAEREVADPGGRSLERQRRHPFRLDDRVGALADQVQRLVDRDAASMDAGWNADLATRLRPRDDVAERSIGPDARRLGNRSRLRDAGVDALLQPLLRPGARTHVFWNGGFACGFHCGRLWDVDALESFQCAEQSMGELLDVPLANRGGAAHLLAVLAEVDELVLVDRLRQLVAFLLELFEVLGVDEVDGQDEVVAAEALFTGEEPFELLAAPLPLEVAGGDDRHEEGRLSNGFLEAALPVLAPVQVLGVEEELEVAAEEVDSLAELVVKPLRDPVGVVPVVLARVAHEDAVTPAPRALFTRAGQEAPRSF